MQSGVTSRRVRVPRRCAQGVGGGRKDGENLPGLRRNGFAGTERNVPTSEKLATP